MKSQGPKHRKVTSAYSALAKEAIEHPQEWFEYQIQEGDSSPLNRIAYSIATLLCDITQRDGVLYVQYHGGADQDN